MRQAAPGLPASARVESFSDLIGGVFKDVPAAQLERLVHVLERAAPRLSDIQAGDLSQAAAAAVAEPNAKAALEHLSRLAQLDPARAQLLTREPALASLQPQLSQLVERLTSTAKLRAETLLHAAAAVSPPEPSASAQLPLPILLQVATRLIESGGMIGYLQSAAVSEKVLDGSWWAPVNTADSQILNTGRKSLNGPKIARLWLVLGVFALLTSWIVSAEETTFVLAIWVGGFVILALGMIWQKSGLS